jgi:F420-dependent oxidoreductase-like protein
MALQTGPMRFGFHFLDFTLADGPASYAPVLRSTAKAAEDAGASWFTVMDHYFQMEQFRTAHDPMLEGYTTLGFLAAVTERVRLGTVVTGVTYRQPGLLAKIGTTLDVLSGGRAFLGIGAAWYEREHRALGVPYPPVSERFERLEEALQILRQMWSEDEGPFEGKHYQLAETINVPQNLTQPHPPVVIGGSGERKTLKLVAQYADACNLIVADTDQLAHKLEVLRRHCDEQGRDYASVGKTVMGPQGNPLDDVDGFLRLAEDYAGLGVDHIHLRALTPDPAGHVAAFGERIAPRLTQVG